MLRSTTQGLYTLLVFRSTPRHGVLWRQSCPPRRIGRPVGAASPAMTDRGNFPAGWDGSQERPSTDFLLDRPADGFRPAIRRRVQGAEFRQNAPRAPKTMNCVPVSGVEPGTPTETPPTVKSEGTPQAAQAVEQGEFAPQWNGLHPPLGVWLPIKQQFAKGRRT
jgi:hypothetical protein